MQMFFLKNMVSVSIAALLFSATISLGTMADQEAAPTTPEEAAQPSLAASNEEKSTEVDSLSKTDEPALMLDDMNSSLTPPSDETTMKLPIGEDGSDSSLYQEMIEGELNPIEAPEETAESRVQERFNLLNEDEGMNPNNPSPPDEMSDLNPSTQVEDVPPVPEQEPAPLMSGADTDPQGSQAVTIDPGNEAVGDIPEAQPSMLESDTVQVVPQESMLVPDTSEDLPNQDVPMQVPTDGTETPTASQMQYKIIRPNVIMAPKPGDQKESGTEKKKEEEWGPGAKGQSKGGRQKGQRFIEQQTNPKIIPIIRMGENLQESSGFTIIKPWNS